MKLTVLFTVLFAALGAFANNSFPTGPDPELTPGDVCHHPDTYRYEEKIAYCERDVDTDLKYDIIDTYDQELGFTISNMPRNKFKIDHYIPLCMGGSNERVNLWPQHESVYKITDPLEAKLCEKMSEGKLLQAKAIELIRRAKNNLSEAPAILREVSGM